MVPAFALILVSAAKYRELTSKQIKQNALIAARAIASEQDRVLENAHEFLVTLSRVPQIRDNDRAACSKILAGLLEPRYADLVVADRNGNPLCSALPPGKALANSRSRHHRRSLETYDFAVGEIRHSPSNPKTLLDVSYPVIDRPGVVRAVVSAALDLSWINRTLVESHLYPGAAFTLVSQRGDVILRYPTADWVGKRIFSDSGISITLSAEPEQTIEASGPDGVPRLFAFSRLKNSMSEQAVYAAVDLPMEIALATSKEILMKNLLALGILSAIILGSTWFGTDVLVLRRIRDIIAATRQIAAGNLGARTTLAYDYSELGQMARAFDNLAAALENRQAEAMAAGAQIQQQRKQQQALYNLNRGITSTLDVSSVLKTLLDHIWVLFRSQPVIVSRIDPKTENLETIAHRGFDDLDSTDADLAAAQSLARLVLARQTPVVISEEGADSLQQEFLLHQPWKSYFGLPLIAKGETFGVLSFYSRDKHTFSPDEIDFLNALVNEAAVAIHNSQLFERTREQAAELEKSNKIKDEFLGVMSHELRTPLNIIMNYSEALRMGTFGEIGSDQARGIEKIHRQAGQLLSLINGILEITKIESGTIAVDARPVDLNDFMTELKSDYILPMEKDVALIWSDTAVLPVIVSDRIKLKQVMTNLINNAIKFTQHGSITISAEIAADGQTLEIHVADTGPGIPSELLPFVFDKFRQIDSATTRNYSGAGLGLYIVKNFVDLLGGTINVRSRLDEGSVFTVRLPIHSVPGQAEKASPLSKTGERYTI